MGFLPGLRLRAKNRDDGEDDDGIQLEFAGNSRGLDSGWEGNDGE